MPEQPAHKSVKQLFDLKGRVAIITGGSIGLGRQMAEALAEAGANLVLCARKKERCEEAAHDMEKLGARALALACDVKDQASVEQLVAATVSAFGRIDVLINNAGISWGAPTEMSDKVIDHKRDYLLSPIPARRFGTDHDLKGAAVFLASDASAYVNGHVLVVDGGQCS